MVKSNTWIIVAIIAVLAVGMLVQKNYGLFAVGSSGTLSRTLPTSSLPSSSFQVTYTASGTPAKWGAIISEALSGGCTFSGGATSYKAGFLSTEGNTKSVTINTPSSGTCTLTGYYQFSEDSTKTDFPTSTISICQRNTPADTNCDNKVSDSEILIYLTKWINNQITDSEILSGISAWVQS